MVVIGNSNPFSLVNFLTKQEAANCKLMTGHLREFFEESLLWKNVTNDCASARQVLVLYGQYAKWHEKNGEQVLLRLLKSSKVDSLDSLKKLTAIVSGGWGDHFFACATTSRLSYYSAEEIKEMIDLFHSVTAANRQVAVDIESFDNGGKEYLLKLLEKPPQSNSLGPEVPTLSGLDTILKGATSLHFADFKSSVIRYLVALNQVERLPVSTYLQFFRSIDTEHASLPKEVKNFIVLVVLLVTTTDQGAVQYPNDQEELRQFLDLIASVYSECGEVVVKNLSLAPCAYKSVSLGECSRVLSLLLTVFRDHECRTELLAHISGFSNNALSLRDLGKKLELLATSQLNFEVDDQESSNALRDKFLGKLDGSAVLHPFPEDVVVKIIGQYEVVKRYCNEYRLLKIEELVAIAAGISAKLKSAPADDNDILKLVAVGRLAIRLEYSMYLYDTQVCTVLLELAYKQGVVAQVKTGEGKTKIIALIGFVLAQTTKDSPGFIISSSQALAIRDYEDHCDFYRKFGVHTSHICERSFDKSCFQGQILYGTATDFEFVIMREMLNGEKIFPPTVVNGTKRFSWAIIDEIDNLTIDTALSGARLSLPAEVRSDWVYEPIYRFVKQRVVSGNNGFDKTQLVGDLRKNLLEYRGGKYAARLNEFSDKKLGVWIESSIKSLHSYREKADYIVACEYEGNEPRSRDIRIVDAKNTGRIMHGSRWGHGLHEFVEVKHGIDVQQESICPISISHPVFYQMFDAVYGITGTIGSAVERSELKDVYSLDSYDVPTYRPLLRKDMPTKIYNTDLEYYRSIIDVARGCGQAGRPLLLLCETIEDTEELAKQFLSESIKYEVLNEIQKKLEKEIIEGAGLPGAVTIATNTAGRGTDIKPSLESLLNGGLHAVFVFEPESERVEFQGRGRAGRQGQPGSSEIVLSKERLVKDKPLFAALDTETIVVRLAAIRESKALKEKNQRLFHAVAEREVFAMVDDFYKKMNAFSSLGNNSFVLNKLIGFLNSRRVSSNEVRDYSGSLRKNRQIIDEALELLTNSGDAKNQWRSLIEKIFKRMRDQIIHDFATEFKEEVSDSIQYSTAEFNQSLKNPFEFLFKKVEQGVAVEIGVLGVEELFSRHSLEMKQRIKAQYTQSSVKWEKYFDDTGLGVLVYLGELLRIDLSVFKADRW